jgi:hypothetical protein
VGQSATRDDHCEGRIARDTLRAVTPANSSDALLRAKNEDVDDKGTRTIRHTSAEATVVSRVDNKGRLLRQELTLGTEVVVWAHGTRIRTGLLATPGADAAQAAFDVSPSRVRLDRARQYVERSAGSDKYLQHLARTLLLSAGLGLTGAEVVTRQLDSKLERRQAAERAANKKRGLIIAALALIAFIVTLVALRH